RVYANGRVQDPDGDLNSVLSGRMSRYAELPHLLFDGSGALWMVFRHWTLAKPHEIYHFYATRLSGDKWSTPWRLSSSSGQNTQHASLTMLSDGKIAVGYSSDGRSPTAPNPGPDHAPHYNSFVSMLPAGEGPPTVGLHTTKLP